MKCNYCGAELQEGAAVCHQCGAQMSEAENKFLKQVDVSKNTNMKAIKSLGKYTVYEHQQDLSCDYNCMNEYFAKEMNVKKRQVLITLNNNSAKVQSGAMQWMFGDVESETGLGSGIKAVGNLLKGAVKSMVTSESAVKPLYKGLGLVMLEPTYKHIILEDISSWGDGIVIDDGLFLACDAQLKEHVILNSKSISTAFANKGIWNLSLSGEGVVVLESPVPREELIEFNLNNDTLKIDGSMAIAWSKSLEFTCERSSRSLIGSMMNKEGLVNVYRGTGKVLMTPIVKGTLMNEGSNPVANVKKGILDGFQTSISD